MILHTVNSSPFSTFALQDCLKLLGADDSLLLTNDAVIAASVRAECKKSLFQLHEDRRLFILDVDLQARGLNALCGQVINYDEFVSLSIKCQSQLAW